MSSLRISSTLSALFYCIISSAGLMAFPGFTRGQIKAHASKYAYKTVSVYPSLQQYTKDKRKIEYTLHRGQVAVVELHEKNMLWQPDQKPAAVALSETMGAEIAQDFQSARLIWEGQHYATDVALHLYFYQRVVLSKAQAMQGARMIAIEKTKVYQGQRYVYEDIEDIEGEKNLLRIRPIKDASTIPGILTENERIYQQWRKDWMRSASQYKQGEIQHQVIGLDKLEEGYEESKELPRDVFFFYVPRSLKSDQQTTLVLINHGDGDGGRHVIKSWLRLAEKHKIILAAPAFNYNRFGGELDTPEMIKLTIEGLQARLKNDFKIRKGAILNGFSSGGAYTYIFANDHPELVRAYSIHSTGAIGGFDTFQPKSKVSHIPVLVTCGAKGPYCSASQGFITTAKQMGFKDARYETAAKFKGMYAAVDRFLSRLNP